MTKKICEESKRIDIENERKVDRALYFFLDVWKNLFSFLLYFFRHGDCDWSEGELERNEEIKRVLILRKCLEDVEEPFYFLYQLSPLLVIQFYKYSRKNNNGAFVPSENYPQYWMLFCSLL